MQTREGREAAYLRDFQAAPLAYPNAVGDQLDDHIGGGRLRIQGSVPQVGLVGDDHRRAERAEAAADVVEELSRFVRHLGHATNPPETVDHDQLRALLPRGGDEGVRRCFKPGLEELP